MIVILFPHNRAALTYVVKLLFYNRLLQMCGMADWRVQTKNYIYKTKAETTVAQRVKKSKSQIPKAFVGCRLIVYLRVSIFESIPRLFVSGKPHSLTSQVFKYSWETYNAFILFFCTASKTSHRSSGEVSSVTGLISHSSSYDKEESLNALMFERKHDWS